MIDFFTANQIHLDGKCLLDAASVPTLASLGTDNMIYLLNTETKQQQRFNVDHSNNFDAMALAPDARSCLIGSKDNTVLKYNFEDGMTVKLLQTNGGVTAIKYAPSGRYIAIGSEQGKTIIYEPSTLKKEKCRPGHSDAICSIFLNGNQEFMGSIGRDQHLLVYRTNNLQQIQEVARFPITKLKDYSILKGSFDVTKDIVFAPGMTHLQKIECIEGKWLYSKSSQIYHPSEIIIAQTVKKNTLVTSSIHQVCIWSIRQEEKLFEIDPFHLTSIVPLTGKFYGMNDDGKLYQYKNQIREEEPMQIENDQEDRIEFQINQSVQEEAEEEEPQRREVQYYQQKKTKADKMITCFPQPLITTSTAFFEGNRFLFANRYGYVIERQEGDQQTIIELELEGQGKRKGQKINLFRNRNMNLFSLNHIAVVYADQTTLGFKPTFESNYYSAWEITWSDIQAVVIGTGWIAGASSDEIKILDMAGHMIKTIAFDRQIIALRAYQNILIVAYHQSIPLWGSQQLSMQIFVINEQISQMNLITNTHVPIKPKSLLKWFDFSLEGMLFSQDTTGNLRAFSLQTCEWTTLSVDQIEDVRKIWVIGIKDYQLIFWKTTDQDPQPTVAPRFNIKNSEFSVTTVGTHPEGTQKTYQKLLWNRYTLDHQKARSRLWGRLKLSRPQQSQFYHQSQTIQTERRIAAKHIQLDEKYYSLVEKYLKSKESVRALLLAQNCIRSLEAAKKLTDLFDYENQRNLAIKFQNYCLQREKQLDYEQMQMFQFIKLREDAERTIKPPSENPMKRTGPKKITQSIPSFSQSIMSQESMENISQKLNNSRISQNQSIQLTQNPFAKKKISNESLEDKKKEIFNNVEKYGIKRKTEERKNIGKNK